jgi:hypothetical protein
VNPSEPVRSAWVHIADTGSRYNPSLDEWELWLNGMDDACHAVEREALAIAKGELRPAVPTADDLLELIDWDRKRSAIEAWNERQRMQEKARDTRAKDMEKHNDE